MWCTPRRNMGDFDIGTMAAAAAVSAKPLAWSASSLHRCSNAVVLLALRVGLLPAFLPARRDDALLLALPLPSLLPLPLSLS